jgi:hypothetical protein
MAKTGNTGPSDIVNVDEQTSTATGADNHEQLDLVNADGQTGVAAGVDTQDKKSDNTGRVTVRILSEYDGVQPGGLANVDVKLAKTLCASGVADDHADAVEYALDQGVDIVEL